MCVYATRSSDATRVTMKDFSNCKNIHLIFHFVAFFLRFFHVILVLFLACGRRLCLTCITNWHLFLLARWFSLLGGSRSHCMDCTLHSTFIVQVFTHYSLAKRTLVIDKYSHINTEKNSVLILLHLPWGTYTLDRI